jgi:hypothetical protein
MNSALYFVDLKSFTGQSPLPKGKQIIDITIAFGFGRC